MRPDIPSFKIPNVWKIKNRNPPQKNKENPILSIILAKFGIVALIIALFLLMLALIGLAIIHATYDHDNYYY